MSFEELLARVDTLNPSELLVLDRKIRERFNTGPSVARDAFGHLLDGVDDLPGDLNSNPKHMEDFGR